MQKQLTIRKAALADAAQISALICRVAYQFSATDSGELAEWFVESVSPSEMAGYIDDARFNYLVGFMGDVLAGIVAVRDTSHVRHLFVAPEFHRRGVAAALWERAKADAIVAGNREGFSVLSSEFAVPVYERFGFSVVGERGEKDGIVFVPMRLALL